MILFAEPILLSNEIVSICVGTIRYKSNSEQSIGLRNQIFQAAGLFNVTPDLIKFRK